MTWEQHCKEVAEALSRNSDCQLAPFKAGLVQGFLRGAKWGRFHMPILREDLDTALLRIKELESELAEISSSIVGHVRVTNTTAGEWK